MQQHNTFYKYRYLVLWGFFFYVGLGWLVILIGYLKHLEIKAIFEPYFDSHECDDPECSRVTKRKMEEAAKREAETAERERIFREKKQREREEKKKRKEEEKRRKAQEANEVEVEE